MLWNQRVRPLFLRESVDQCAKSYCSIFGFEHRRILRGDIPLSREKKNLPPNLRLIYHTKDTRIAPIGIIFDPLIEKNLDYIKTYFERLKRYNRACIALRRTKPELYVIFGKRKVVWVSDAKGTFDLFEIQITLGKTDFHVFYKLERLCRENVEYDNDLILGRTPRYQFLFNFEENFT